MPVVLDLVNVVEVYNEAIGNSTGPEQRALFDTFQGVFAYRIWELNNSVRVGLFCLPAGNFGFAGEPTLTDFPKSLALPKNKVFMCFHEYSWYTWDWEAEARCLRYRIQMAGLSVVPGFSSPNAGLTHAVISSYPDVGWRTGIHGEHVRRWRCWYDSELQKDDYVVGAALFNCGPSYGWDTFECTAEWEESALRSQPAQPKPGETLEEFIRRKSWTRSAWTTIRKPPWARYATRYGLGKPETQEFDLVYSGIPTAFGFCPGHCVLRGWAIGIISGTLPGKGCVQIG